MAMRPWLLAVVCPITVADLAALALDTEQTRLDNAVPGEQSMRRKESGLHPDGQDEGPVVPDDRKSGPGLVHRIDGLATIGR